MIALRNVTKNTLISAKAKIASSFYDRLAGLLDVRNPRYLLFRTRFGLHTFFLKTPIDVILLNDQYQIVKTKTGLSPNRLFLYHPKYSLVIEMPQGSIKKYHLAINDKISIA